MNSSKEKSIPKDYIPPSVSCWTALSTKDPESTMKVLKSFFVEKQILVIMSTNDEFSFSARSPKYSIAVSIYKRDNSFVVMFRRLNGDVVLYNNLFKEIATHTGLKLTTCIANSSNPII